MRLQTQFLDSTCSSNHIDAFAHNDNWCPSALNKYGTTSCLNACMYEMRRGISRPTWNNRPACLRVSTNGDKYCNGFVRNINNLNDFKLLLVLALLCVI
ncbi:hypothetical protein PIROE2DRAFT_19349 [Piromyces sp. E2]|nr:hypothetical protein PIROE2DRAFT_19349 [Piromyces sp. E2]|eukprot:OUM56167.1 hypothetical protein PIROE2DRAFT_19349 [Piromyces sp. E2]